MALNHSIQRQPVGETDTSQLPGAGRVPPKDSEESRRRLLTTLITWANVIAVTGLLINSLWFLWDFWNTLAQNSLGLVMLLIGLWCLRLTRRGQIQRAARIYLATTMFMTGLAMLVVGQSFVLNVATFLCLFVLLATFLESPGTALRWGILSIGIYTAALSMRIFLPARELTFSTQDLVGLYLFPMFFLTAFTFLGSNAAKRLGETRTERETVHRELGQSHRALQEAQGELQTTNEQLRRELTQRELAEKVLAQKVEELRHSHELIAALSHVAASIDSAPGLDQIMQTLGSELKEADLTCLVALSDAEDQALVVCYTSIESSAVSLAEKLSGIDLLNYRVPRGIDILRGMIQRGRPAYMDNAIPLTTALLPSVPEHLIERLVRMIGLGPGMATVYLPLTVEGRLVGALAVWGPGLKHSDVLALSVFATQVATTIENARLHEQAQQEIAERRQVEEELRESERRLATFLDSSPDSIYIFDLAAHKLVYLNRVGFCGYSRAEVTADNSLLHAVHPDDLGEVRDHWQRMLLATDGDIIPIEYRLRAKDGTWEWIVDRRVILSRDADGAPAQVLVTLSHFTDRKRVEEALVRAERLAALNQVAVTVNHEINSPLTALLLYAATLLRSDSPLSATDREALQDIQKSAIRIRDVVRKLDDIEDRTVRYAGGIEMIDIRGEPERSDQDDAVDS